MPDIYQAAVVIGSSLHVKNAENNPYLAQLIQLRNYLSLIDDTNAVKLVNCPSKLIDYLT